MNLRDLFFSPPCYLLLQRKRLVLRDTGSGRRIDEVPLVAISRDGRKRILGVGRAAEQEALRSGEDFDLVNGFDHPRTIIRDFNVAEKTLQHFIHRVYRAGSLLRPSPSMIIQVSEPFEGGLTEVELRALCELAAGAGAREVAVWDGPELSDEAIRRGRYPGDHWLTKPPGAVRR
ncbi:rod shape-determining protein [Endothiovibrio diazotrophicus]